VSQYSESDLDPGIYTVPVAGGTPKQIVATGDADEDSSVQFSPDGKSVAFARDDVDSHGIETVTLELAPVATGTPRALATGLIPDPTDGQRLSFSPDGTTIAYAGDFEDPGIYAVAVAGGSPGQLTTDFDYWPSYSADGTHVYFSRDSGSYNAEDTSDNDVYELWTMAKDGTGPAIVSEGDFESLVLGPTATAAAPGGGGGGGGGSGSPATTTTTTPTGAPTTTPATAGSTATAPKTTATKPKPVATHVKVTAKKAGRYLVRWTGKASEWKVTLKVGRKTASTTVRGAVHSHTFVLPGAKGHASASVKPA
jgi:dipeptidyl aminopeptidase/acylaminoacyl peptidase